MKVHNELTPTHARALLMRALEANPPRLDLAAVAIATLETPEIEVAEIERKLDALADRVKQLASPRGTALSQAQALKHVLGDEEGFTGDNGDYSAPENSFINRVFERKRGLPIALSVIYLEVARRAGMRFFGVSFPGHFLVATDVGAEPLVVDPFNGGQILTAEGCAELLRGVAPQLRFSVKMISPAPVKTIAYRMLANLKKTFLERAEGERALKAVDLMLLLSPDHPGELRARAGILSALGAYQAALADVERCLALSPSAPDHQMLMLTANALRQRVTYLN